MDFFSYVQSRSGQLLQEALGHIQVVAVALVIASVLGIGIAVATHSRRHAREAVLLASAAWFTVPPIAFLSLLIAPIGLGFTPSVIALTLYSLLPIIRNGVAGLIGVDPAIVEAGRGMGMGGARLLLTVQLPVAWPVIFSGVRIAAQIAIGVAAVAAYVGCPGFGNEIFFGLARLGAANSLNAALAGTLGVVLVAVLFDIVLVMLNKLVLARRVAS